MYAEIDHLVVAAANLEEGVAYLEKLLGVPFSGGGKHLVMGTHNRLLRLDGTRYLEVIAIDPEGDAPRWARWFGLDTPEIQQKIAERPRLITWVARTSDIESTLAASGFDHGKPRPMSRGELRWHFTFTDDGSLLEGGLVPPLIQWQAEPHPAERMPESGCALDWMEGVHPDPISLFDVLNRLGLPDVFTLEQGDPPALRAVIRTPHGVVILD